MKLKITLLAILATVSFTFGQNSMVVSAFTYLQNYQRDKQGEPEALNKAKEYIDKVTEQKDLEKPKYWYYRGNIYFEIGQSKNANHAALDPDPYFVAAEAYQKCVFLDPKYEFANIAKQQLRYCSAQVLNKGVTLFSANDYAGALAQFEKNMKIADAGKAWDTLAVRNGILAARNGKNYDKAIELINKSIVANVGGSGNYLELSRVYLEKKDTVMAIKTLQDGRTKYGNDVGLIIDELNIYLGKGDNVNAERILKDAIAVDSKNASLYFAAGAVYSDLGRAAQDKGDGQGANDQYTKAEYNYKKALEINPGYGDALFNLGVVYVNRGNMFIDVSNGFVDKRKFTEADAEKAKGMDQYKIAIDYIEKARGTISNPKLDNKTADSYYMYLKALKDLYGKVENFDKLDEMKKLIDEFKK